MRRNDSPRRGRRLARVDGLNPARRHRPDVQIVLYMSLLMLLGLVVMFAIGSQRAHVLNESMGASYSNTYFFTKQLISIAVAVVAFAATAILPYEWILKRRSLWLYIGFGLCALLAIASFTGWGVAEETLGATRWFNLGPFGSVQPAEILKFSLVIYLACFLSARMQAGETNSWQESLLPVGLIVGLAALFIIVIQKDLGTGASLFSLILVMLMIARVSWRNLAIISGVVLGVAAILVVSAPHRMARIMTFTQGDSAEQNAANYHVEHAKTAIGAGGLLGVGIGNSVQATGYLPEAINDSVFAIMGETFGFVGLVATIALFVALLMRLIKVIEHLADYRLRLLVSGVFGWLVAHFILNIGAMIGIIPLTGITLPLLSFGGTSMILVSAALGLVFQVSRYTSREKVTGEGTDEGIISRRRIGRTRHASRSRFA